MSYQLSQPSPPLAPYVKNYWGLSSCSEQESYHIQRIVPVGLISLYFYFNARPQVVSGKPTIDHSVFITGQINQAYDLRVGDSIQLFAITFQPLGAFYLFGKPVHELFNNCVSFQSWCGFSITFLSDKLYEATSFEQRVKIMEVFLIQQMQASTNILPYSRMNSSIDLIHENAGQTGLQDMAGKACLSPKHYQRLFNECIGITPKGYLRIVRFQQALLIKQFNSTIDLTTLAYQCNYYDQAHMINDFKKLTGLTPGKYFSQCDPYSDYFND